MSNRPLLFLLGLLLMLPQAAPAQELWIHAASSLQEVAAALADSYRQQHPELELRFNFAGSQLLRTQIEQGAPADLFISADRQAMVALHEQGRVQPATVVTRNQLCLAVTSQATARLTSLRGLAAPGLLLAVGNERVPVGRYTEQLLAGLAADPGFGPRWVAAVRNNVISRENQVKAIVAKLLLGAVDAGLIYRTDLTPANRRQLKQHALPAEYNPRAGYPAAVVIGGREAQAAAFLDFMLSPQGQAIFARHRFLPAGESP